MSLFSPESLSQIIEELAADVHLSDRASLEERRRIFREWLSNPVVKELLFVGLERIEAEIQEHVEMIAVGMAGLARTLHVASNQELMPIELADQQGKFDQVDQAMANINLANSIQHTLGLDKLPPWTIHSYNPIDWEGEYAQDQGTSFTKLGKVDRALEVLNNGLRSADYFVEYMESDGLPDLTDRSTTNKHELRTRNRYLGALSAKGVLEYRIARLEHSVTRMTAALTTLNKSQSLRPNTDRLAAVTKTASKAMFDKEFDGSLRERVQLGKLVVMSGLRVILSKLKAR